MVKILYFVLILAVLSNCTRNPVIKTHGISYLEKRQKSLVLNKSNTNDARKLLGSPSSIGVFDNTVWIYIEKVDTNTKLTTLGRKKLLKNNVLVLKFNNLGILNEKKFLDKNQMKKIKFSNEETSVVNKEQDFIYNFLSSIRQKMLGKRR